MRGCSSKGTRSCTGCVFACVCVVCGCGKSFFVARAALRNKSGLLFTCKNAFFRFFFFFFNLWTQEKDILRILNGTGAAALEFFGYTPDSWGRFRNAPGRVLMLYDKKILARTPLFALILDLGLKNLWCCNRLICKPIYLLCFYSAFMQGVGAPAEARIGPARRRVQPRHALQGL